MGNAQNRDSGATKDQKFVNCYPETTKNSLTNAKKLYLVKRPGFEVTRTIASGEGRGIWYWNGYEYSVIGSTLYRNSTSVQTLKTSTGLCGAVDFIGSNGRQLFFCDGEDGYLINEDNSIENVEKAFLRWSSEEIVGIGDRRVPTTSNGYYYRSITEGTASTVEPTWPTTIGNTVVDGTITWECRGVYTGAVKFVNAHTYSVGDLVVPTTENSLWYKVVVGGLAIFEPTWPLVIGDTIVSGAVTFECMGYFGGFPSPHVPTPCYMDGYVFLSPTNSVDINNSSLNPNTVLGVADSWNPLDYISANQFPDNIVALVRQNNYVVALGDNNIEAFYDNGNTPGSPLERNQTLTAQVGLVNRYCVQQSEKAMMFVSKSDAGKISVWILDGTNSKEISTEYQERILSAETGTISTMQFRIDGHFFFLIILPNQNKTLVYDIEEQIWVEWDYLPYTNFTFDGTDLKFQHKTAGTTHRIKNTLYQDNGVNFTVSVQIAKQDFDVQQRKFFHRLDVIGDQINTSLNISWSDDDYQTFSTPMIVNLLPRAYITRCGSSRRRAWKFTHSDNTPLRLEALEVVYTKGEN